MMELVNDDGKSPLDLESSYYRNAKLFPDANFVSAPLAERYEEVIGGVPYSSYFPLFPDSQGLPISFRVAHGLQVTFQALTQKAENSSNLPQSRENLRQAHQSVERADWLTAVGQAAQAFRLGTSVEKKQARALLEQMADEAKAYVHFAPAPRKNVLYTNYGEIPVVAYLSDDDAKWYTQMINGGMNRQTKKPKEMPGRVKVNRYLSASRVSVV